MVLWIWYCRDTVCIDIDAMGDGFIVMLLVDVKFISLGQGSRAVDIGSLQLGLAASG